MIRKRKTKTFKCAGCEKKVKRNSNNHKRCVLCARKARCAVNRKYERTPEGARTKRKYNCSPKGRRVDRRYKHSPKALIAKRERIWNQLGIIVEDGTSLT